MCVPICECTVVVMNHQYKPSSLQIYFPSTIIFARGFKNFLCTFWILWIRRHLFNEIFTLINVACLPNIFGTSIVILNKRSERWKKKLNDILTKEFYKNTHTHTIKFRVEKKSFNQHIPSISCLKFNFGNSIHCPRVGGTDDDGGGLQMTGNHFHFKLIRARVLTRLTIKMKQKKNEFNVKPQNKWDGHVQINWK